MDTLINFYDHLLFKSLENVCVIKKNTVIYSGSYQYLIRDVYNS